MRNAKVTPAEITPEELAAVDVVPGDETRFKCKLCKGEGAFLLKRDCIRHFRKCHPDDKVDLSKWQVKKDGNILKTKSGKLLSFSKAMAKAKGVADSTASSMPTRGAPAQQTTNLVDEPIGISMPPPAAGSMASAPSAPIEATGLPYREPTVTIKEFARNWTKKQTKKGAERINWPKELIPDDDYEGYKAYKKFMKAGKASKTVREKSIRGLDYIRGCLDIEGGDGTLLALLMAVHKQGVLMKLFKLKLIKKTKSYQFLIYNALTSVVDFFLAECSDQEGPGWDKVEKSLGQIKSRFLMHQKSKNRKKKAKNKRLKRGSDGMKIDNLPPVETVKQVARKAMLALAVLVKAHKGSGELPWLVRFTANVLMVGILEFTSWCGRSMEWETMHASHVTKQSKAGKEYVYGSVHKTEEHYGDAGKWMPPCTWAAILLFITLPYRGTKLLFEPPKARTKLISMHSVLQKFCKVFTPSFAVWTVTLARKFYARSGVKTIKAARSVIAAANQNAPDTAEAFYEAESAYSSAMKGKATVQAILGDAIEFPSQQEIKDYEKENSAEDIVSWFARQYTEQDDDPEQQAPNEGEGEGVGVEEGEEEEEQVTDAEEQEDESEEGPELDDSEEGVVVEPRRKWQRIEEEYQIENLALNQMEKIAAQTLLSQGNAQLLAGMCLHLFNQIGSRMGGVFPSAQILDRANIIPIALLAFYPELHNSLAGICEDSEDGAAMIPNTKAKQIVGMMGVLAADSEAFWNSQGGKGSCSSA